MLKNYLWLHNNNIKIGFTEKDKQFIEETSIALQKAIKFLSKYFLLKKSFPPIRAILAPNRKEYDRLVKDWLKVKIESPSRPSRIAQPQRADLVLLAPSAYATDSINTYSAQEYKRLIFHETTHMFEEYLSPNIEASPLWWSEGLAVYLSEQWKYEDDIRTPVIEGIRCKDIPKMKEIQREIKLSYQWGWSIVKYIEYNFGRDAVLNVISNCGDGDIFKIIGKTIKDIEIGWKKYLQDIRAIFNSN